MKVSPLFTTKSQTFDLVSRFSSSDKCIRVMSYVFRFYQKVRKSYLQFTDQIEAEEAVATKSQIIQIAQ